MLSIGARQTSDVWRMELGTLVKRMNLISNIRKVRSDADTVVVSSNTARELQVLLKVNASAVEVSWTLGALDSALDPSLLSKFVEDLRDALPKVSTPFLLLGQPPCSCETL